MNRQNVESSSIKSIGYDPFNEFLEVEFVRGAIYQYVNVPAEVFSQLENADSIGSYFSKNIAKKYKYEKVNL